MIIRSFVVTTSLLLAGCGIECDRYCPQLQTLIFKDSAGNALTPLRVTDGRGKVHTCADESLFVTCQENRFTFDQRNDRNYRLRAEATTGEVFDADFTAAQEATGMMASSCNCTSSKRFTEQTITLSKP